MRWIWCWGMLSGGVILSEVCWSPFAGDTVVFERRGTDRKTLYVTIQHLMETARKSSGTTSDDDDDAETAMTACGVKRRKASTMGAIKIRAALGKGQCDE